MDESRINILNQSTRIISKLQLLSVFFNNDIIFKIYLRTQVIHQLFATNPELDITKLELFHVQFTESLIELLKKVKKHNEVNADLLMDEVQLNNELIGKMDDTAYSENNFHNDQQRQALKMSQSLRRLYEVLSNELGDYPFAKNINMFGARYAPDYFAEIDTALLDDLLRYEPAELYVNRHATIQRKLMGRLCKYDFRISFYRGLKATDVTLEVYKFIDIDQYFIYSPANNIFLFCDIDKLAGIVNSNNVSKKERMMQELLDKNVRLQSSAGVIKTHLPTEILDLLEADYKKISDVDFLQHMNNFDVQANILRSMLNTDII